MMSVIDEEGSGVVSAEEVSAANDETPMKDIPFLREWEAVFVDGDGG